MNHVRNTLNPGSNKKKDLWDSRKLEWAQIRPSVDDEFTNPVRKQGMKHLLWKRRGMADGCLSWAEASARCCMIAEARSGTSG